MNSPSRNTDVSKSGSPGIDPQLFVTTSLQPGGVSGNPVSSAQTLHRNMIPSNIPEVSRPQPQRCNPETAQAPRLATTFPVPANRGHKSQVKHQRRSRAEPHHHNSSRSDDNDGNSENPSDMDSDSVHGDNDGEPSQSDSDFNGEFDDGPEVQRRSNSYFSRS